MAILIPDVTKLTSATTSMVDVMSSLRTHFTSTSTKFSVVANTPDDDGFTITPVAATETWQMNFRRLNTTLARIAIDPLAGITDSGDTSTVPTLTDSTEWSEEASVLETTGTNSTQFYVIEMADALIVLMVSAALDDNPHAMHAGKTWIPYFTDGTNGDNYADGLGIHGPDMSFNATTGWFNTSTSNLSRIRCAQTGGFAGTSSANTFGWYRAHPGVFTVGRSSRIKGLEKPRPFDVVAEYTDGTLDTNMGYSKYCLGARSTASAGAYWDAGASADAWIHVGTSPSATNQVIPWDRSVTPIF